MNRANARNRGRKLGIKRHKRAEFERERRFQLKAGREWDNEVLGRNWRKDK
jgi:hypothetical protein